ncbi:hypothetical protein GGR57DRAFT_516795 [Xylariaceae sp. FL1272]|nr:hypothetical protein GGR57DRAFT_516795 [Xylariaceae sp. FL1272]
MSANLHLLRTNATLFNSTPENRSKYSISVEHPQGLCKITIAALKPFPLALQRDPNQPSYVPVNPGDWVQVTHGSGPCDCAAKDAKEIFPRWQELHIKLRYRVKDNAAHPFYPDFEYEDGENLGHASLIACLTLGLRVPNCYVRLYINYGPKELAELFTKHDNVEWNKDAGKFVVSQSLVGATVPYLGEEEEED